MLRNTVFRRRYKSALPASTKFFFSTWAMKKKANGVYRARLVVRGFQKEDGEHYLSQFISSPVVNELTIRIVLNFLLLGRLFGWILDVNGAFLLGHFENGERLYMKVPEGFEEFYGEDEVLELMKTIYGLKQAAHAFWKELLQCVEDIGFQRSDVDPCLYFKRDTKGEWSLLLVGLMIC